MKYITKTLKKKKKFNFFFNFLFILKQKKKILICKLYNYVFFYNRLFYYSFLKFHLYTQNNFKKSFNLSIILYNKFKYLIFQNLITTKVIFLFKGRGLKVVSFNDNWISFKIGFSHNFKLVKNNSITLKVVSKNSQKFELTGAIFQIVQVLACFKFIKNSNLFTNKGLYMIKEKLIFKKSTKSAW